MLKIWCLALVVAILCLSPLVSAATKSRSPLVYRGALLGYSYQLFRIKAADPFRVVVAASNTGMSL